MSILSRLGIGQSDPPTDAEPIPHDALESGAEQATAAYQFDEVTLSAQQLDILMREADRLQTLYLDARGAVQSVFNFYLTFASAVIGAIALLLQLGTDATLLLVIVLFFAVLVGSVYTGALSARYATAARYAYALDEVRRAILQQTRTPLPDVYGHFMQVTSSDDRGVRWYEWVIPTGTYQMFMAVINGASLTLLLWLIGTAVAVPLLSLMIGMVVMFFVTLTIFNIYSRWVMQRFNRVLDVRVDMGRQLALWASRQ